MIKHLAPLIALLSGSAAIAQVDAGDELTLDHYASGDLARAEFSLDERTREGGRITPFFTSYRPQLSVGGADRVTCRFVTKEEGGHRPGTTGEIGMTCPIALTEGQMFEAFERERPIGKGVILPRKLVD